LKEDSKSSKPKLDLETILVLLTNKVGRILGSSHVSVKFRQRIKIMFRKLTFSKKGVFLRIKVAICLRDRERDTKCSREVFRNHSSNRLGGNHQRFSLEGIDPLEEISIL
jgi:hypothetical protein